MTDTGAWFARISAELIAMSGESFTCEKFAPLLARVCAEVSADSEIGVVLLAHEKGPTICAGSTSRAEALLALGERLGEGPAADAIRTGSAMSNLGLDDQRWPAYAPAARKLGYSSLHSFVLLDGEDAIGSIEIFGRGGAGALRTELLQPLADLAAAHISREWALQAAYERVHQLEGALESRVVIEQAKGVIAERFAVPLESAFESLRRHARMHNERLDALSEKVTQRHPDSDLLEVNFFTISATRRAQLRDRAVLRWRQTLAEAQDQRNMAAKLASRSTEARIELDHKRALRKLHTLEKEIDQQIAQFSDGASSREKRPQVLVGIEPGPVCSFVVDALRRDTRLVVAVVGAGSVDLLGRGIAMQPDLVVLGSEAHEPVGADFLSDLHRYCPDSRILVVVENQRDIARLAGRNVDKVSLCGDPRVLLKDALVLCGVGRGSGARSH